MSTEDRCTAARKRLLERAEQLRTDISRELLKQNSEHYCDLAGEITDASEESVADLLVDVSQTGLAAGLEFELFQPQGEVPKDFYAELPIKIRVIGGYHEFGEFVSGLAALPRIVTIHDVQIKPRPNNDLLVLEATARTYRYLDEAGG